LTIDFNRRFNIISMPHITHHPLIVIDIGNSSINCGIFRREQNAIEKEPQTVLRLDTVADFLEPLAGWIPREPVAWWVSSVNRPSENRLRQWVTRHRKLDSYQTLHHDELPIQIGVDLPQSVGMDRLVAAVAANAVRPPDSPVIIVDAGSAITVDLVSKAGMFLGGVILPGLSLAAKSLHQHTDQLPKIQCDLAAVIEKVKGSAVENSQRLSSSSCIHQVKASALPAFVGKSTEQAIRSGLIWGTVGALRFLIENISQQLPSSPYVVYAGGDARYLASLLEEDPVIMPQLVLQGIALCVGHLESNENVS
jgi:type III pantothenate kinase